MEREKQNNIPLHSVALVRNLAQNSKQHLGNYQDKKWSAEDLTCDKDERPIFFKWDIILAPSLDLAPSWSSLVRSPKKWTCPPLGLEHQRVT
jgi:hypothetical protein